MSEPEVTHAVYLVGMAERLYGRVWQSELAKHHGLNLRTVQRIAAAVKAEQDYPVPAGLLHSLAVDLQSQAEEDLDLAEEVLEVLREGEPANENDLNDPD